MHNVSVTFGGATMAAVREQVKAFLGEPSPGPLGTARAEAVGQDVVQPGSGMAPAGGATTASPSDINPVTGKKYTAKERKALEAERGAIGTGGAREPTPGDTADEAAGELAKGHDLLRGKLGEYGNKYGMEAAMEDGEKLFAMIFKDGSVKKISEVPAESIDTVSGGLDEMLEKNPFKREAPKPAAPAAGGSIFAR